MNYNDHATKHLKKAAEQLTHDVNARLKAISYLDMRWSPSGVADTLEYLAAELHKIGRLDALALHFSGESEEEE